LVYAEKQVTQKLTGLLLLSVPASTTITWELKTKGLLSKRNPKKPAMAMYMCRIDFIFISKNSNFSYEAEYIRSPLRSCILSTFS